MTSSRPPVNVPDRSALVLAGVLAAGGTMHFVAPRTYAGLIPRVLGSPRAWVLGSGVAELVCAAAVAHPATRRVGALSSAALFVAVFPGNVTMAVRARKPRRRAVAWARLPLQVPLVLWALAVAGRAGQSGDGPSVGR